MQTLRQDAQTIIDRVLQDAQPDAAVQRALAQLTLPPGRLVLVAVGKAAWQMAHAAHAALGERIDTGIVITKYGHARGAIGPLEIYEAGHPLPDARTLRATKRALALTDGLGPEDGVLFLLSGGGSSLFELPLVPLAELCELTQQLLACGADIVELNTLRKRLSAVKGGKFALHCQPAQIWSIVLSDVLGDRLDMIASGPACADPSTSEEACAVAERYALRLSDAARKLLQAPTPKQLSDVHTYLTGSVRQLCASAAAAAQALGYRPVLLTDTLRCTARDAGSFLASIAQSHQQSRVSLAFLAGGETVVRVTGSGLGGRSQELALSAAQELAGLSQTAVFSFGSDGTDGPTDAAGGYCDTHTRAALAAQGIFIPEALRNNDAYHALRACGGLIRTGPTGTNVNDLAVVLIRRGAEPIQEAEA